MNHFALTHSLTLTGNRPSSSRLILLLKKKVEEQLPCYWFRLEETDLDAAISLGHAALSERSNIVVALARAEVPDSEIAADARKALVAAGLHQAHLEMHPGELPLPARHRIVADARARC